MIRSAPKCRKFPAWVRVPARQVAALGGFDTQRLLQIGGIAAAVRVDRRAFFWWVKSKSHGDSQFFLVDADAADQTAPTPPLPNPIAGSSRRSNRGRDDR